MNEEDYDFDFMDYEKANNSMLLRIQRDAASAAVVECERKLQETNKRFVETIEVLKQQVVAAMAETAKAKKEAEQWRKSYEDLVKCM
jgi:prolyl oligopeptidase PreP (S9A serine peptidase family)